MTIGIAASGANAGLAVFKALAAVEAAGGGAIGGFAAYAAIDAAGVLYRYDTQRGGAATLFTDGETTGVEPPDTIAAAPLAAVISSGPDRPEPLSQFLRADPAVGLVSGHRLPNAPGTDGRAYNEAVLAHLAEGRTVEEAVDAVLDANPQGDVGLIAADLSGRIYARNSERVLGREDLGHARREDAGAVVEVLHNAIRPGPSIAALAAETALDVMVQRWAADDFFVLEAGVPLEAGSEAAVELDDAGLALKVVTTDPDLLTGRKNGAAVYLGAAVRRNGELLGRTVTEPNVDVEDGRIVAMSGQKRMRLGFRRV